MPDVERLARWYLVALAAGLLLEGATLLALGNSSDPRHDALHAVWGVALLILFAAWRQSAWPLVVFGAFYTALAFAGVLMDRPFGLLLGPGENVFHFIVGPLALILGIAGLMRLRARRASAQPAPVRTS